MMHKTPKRYEVAPRQSTSQNRGFVLSILSLLILLTGISQVSSGQDTDSVPYNHVIVHEDYRMQLLAQRETEINIAILKTMSRIGKGFRLMVLTTYDRGYAMKVRTELLQNFPEQKTYMWFARPYIKIKFGNFMTQQEAEVYEHKVSKLLNGISIYVVPDYIELKSPRDDDNSEVN
ncbi:MAG: hypothetical protein KGM98_10525 [Bacteroidota bacterium]|nr:hypothetical protein [Bacteroidota bacterium]